MKLLQEEDVDDPDIGSFYDDDVSSTSAENSSWMCIYIIQTNKVN